MILCGSFIFNSFLLLIHRYVVLKEKKNKKVCGLDVERQTMMANNKNNGK